MTTRFNDHEWRIEKKVTDQYNDFNQKLLIKTKERALKTGENWHAELPENF